MKRYSSRMTDVAKAAGVSPTTVWRVVNESGYVAPETRKRVLKAVRQFDYKVNMVAKSLKTSRTWVIGHVVYILHPNPFFARVAGGVDNQALKEGYNVIICNAHYNREQEEHHVKMLITRRVDGVIFTVPAAVENVQMVIDAGIPCVVIGHEMSDIQVDQVVANNQLGSRLAVDHLANLGHRKIGYIGVGRQGHKDACQRLDGYIEAMNAHGLALNENWILTSDGHHRELGYRLAKGLVQSGNLPTGLFVASDPMAIGVLQALYEAKVCIPDDLSLVGFDDAMAELAVPPLTTVRQPMEDMGTIAVRMLLERIQGSSVSPQMVTLPTSLVVRNSTCSIL